MKPASRHGDDAGTTWVLREHGSAVSSAVLGVSAVQWRPDVHAQGELMAELWALGVRHLLDGEPGRFTVHPYCTPDVVGVRLESPDPQEGALADTVSRVLHAPLPPVDEGEDGARSLRAAAARAAQRTASETAALALVAPPGHRCAMPVAERMSVLWAADLAECRQMIERHRKFVAMAGRDLRPPPGTHPLPGHGSAAGASPRPGPADSAAVDAAPGEDSVTVVRSATAGLAQIATVTPGVALGSTAKAALHVFWTLLREREGVFYPLARSRGGLIYEHAAFTREYHEHGVGMSVLSCDPQDVEQVIACLREATARVAAGDVPPALVDEAAAAVGRARLMSLRNPAAVAKVLLASEVSGVSAEDYPRQLQKVGPAVVSEAARRTVHRAGWLIRVTLPENPA